MAFIRRWRVGWLVWVVAGVTLLLLAGSLVLITLNRSYPLVGKGPWIGQVAWLLCLASAPVVGGLMAHKQPGNAYGWVWLLYGFWRGGVQSFSESYSIYGLLVVPGSLPLVAWGVPLAAVSWLLGIAMLPFILLLFPTGRLPSRRWRLVAWMTGAALVVGLMVSVVVPGESAFVPVENPFGVAGFPGEAAFVLFDASLLTMLTVTLAVVYFGGVLLLQGFFTAVGGSEQPSFAIVFSTLTIAGLFSPLRGRVQDGIDRRFYRRKYDAAQALDAFAATARDEVEMERLAAGLVNVIEETMQPVTVSLWLKPTKKGGEFGD